MYYNEKSAIGGANAAVQYNRTAAEECAMQPTAPLSPVAASLSALCQAQHETHNLISHLESRIEALLIPQPPSTKGSEKDGPLPVRAPICDEIEHRLQMEHSAADRIRSLLDRLSI